MLAQPSSLRLALIGCGAITEQYYTPALLEICKLTNVEVVALCDPSTKRLALIRSSFPAAYACTDFEELVLLEPDVAVIASPPHFHPTQANKLLASGVHVFCEKPMANSVIEAESMIKTARESERLLAIGLFRRFFPALKAIDYLIKSRVLGGPISFAFSEGGQFNWPAASASFFMKSHSKGGVFLDLGVHVLDLMCWWFGPPISHTYMDDSMGNLEANSLLCAKFPCGLYGEVRLSRDTNIANSYEIVFERGAVTWSVGDSNHLDIDLRGVPFLFKSFLNEKSLPSASFSQCFVKQLLNFVGAVRGHEQLLVTGEEGIRSLRLIEEAYANKILFPMPWLSASELVMASSLAGF